MRQAIENLVRNALAHTPSGGLVRVRAVREDDTVRVTVEDTGSGFDPAFLPRAFEPFARGAIEAAGADHGAGLGLAIVRAIMQAHKGRASAENRPEGGARLTLLFPGRP
jgi:signal transduction histidine kinase